MHELSAPSLKPKVDLYDNLIYLILHFPRTRRTAKEPDQEIDFILGKKFLITVRYGANETLHLVSKIFDASAVLNKGSFGPHAGFIFFFLLGKLYEALLHELASIGESLRSVEDRIFGGEEREMVLGLSEISRDILYFKRSLSLHRDVLESFEIAGKKFFGEEFTFHLRALTGDYYRVEHAVESNVAFLSELRETNNALLSTKQNEIMRTLTVLAFIALPATTILSLFQIGAVSRPIVGQPGDFWIILLIVGGLVFSLYSFFRYKHWL